MIIFSELNQNSNQHLKTKFDMQTKIKSKKTYKFHGLLSTQDNLAQGHSRTHQNSLGFTLLHSKGEKYSQYSRGSLELRCGGNEEVRKVFIGFKRGGDIGFGAM